MTPKYTIVKFIESSSPIVAPVTKFGGQPVWIDEPRWPLSRKYGTPMQFICQIVLYANIFGNLTSRMAYLFLTDWNGEGPSPNTADPNSGENAVLLQPGGFWNGPSLPLYEGPTLYRRELRGGRWERTSCEFDVKLRLGEDSAPGAWDNVDPDDVDAWEEYYRALVEDKIGGTPVPTSSFLDPRPGPGHDDWRLLLQVHAKVNDDIDPFFLNFAWDGVGYAFISPDGRIGTFLWTR